MVDADDCYVPSCSRHSSQSRSCQTDPKPIAIAKMAIWLRSAFAVLIFPSFPLMAFSAIVDRFVPQTRLLRGSFTPGPLLGRMKASSSPPMALPSHHFSAVNAPTTDYIVVRSGGDADRSTAKKPLSWIGAILRLGAHILEVSPTERSIWLELACLTTMNARCMAEPTRIHRSIPSYSACSADLRDRPKPVYLCRWESGALDMMLELIGSHYGDALSRSVAEWFVHDRIWAVADREQLQLRLRTGIRDDRVLSAGSAYGEDLREV